MTRLAELVHRCLPALPPADWERPKPSSRGFRRDLLAAGAFLLLALVMQELVQSLTEKDEAVSRTLAYLVTASLVLPLLLRRRYPILMMLLCSAAFLIAGAGETSVVAIQFCNQLAYFLAIYSAVAWAQNRQALKTALGLILLSMALWLILSFFTSDLFALNQMPLVADPAGALSPLQALPIFTFLMNLMYFGGAIFLGLTSWSNAYANELVTTQAQRIASQAQQLADQAVNEERLRIARELHDVIAHHISAVGVQASAARLVQERDPAKAAALMRGIEGSARDAVGETRALLGVLRGAHDAGYGESAPSHRHPEPSLAQLHELVTHQQSLGLQVQLTVAEHSAGFLETLPQGLSLAMYRISSEALSNVRTHSTATRARLTLRSGTDTQGNWVEVEVTDDGRAIPGSAGSGFGLRGIRERASLHRGEVEIGPRSERGWRTRARLRVNTPSPTRVEA